MRWPSHPICFFLHLSASGKNSRNGAKGTNAAGGGWQGREGRRDECQTRFWFLFGAKSAHDPEATVRALAEGRPPDVGRVEKDAKLPSYIKDGLVFTLYGVTPFGVIG